MVDDGGLVGVPLRDDVVAGSNGLLSIVCTYSSIDVSLLCSSSHACGSVSMVGSAVPCCLSLGHPNVPSGVCPTVIDACLDDDLVTGFGCAARVVISVTSFCAPVDSGMVCWVSRGVFGGANVSVLECPHIY